MNSENRTHPRLLPAIETVKADHSLVGALEYGLVLCSCGHAVEVMRDHHLEAMFALAVQQGTEDAVEVLKGIRPGLDAERSYVDGFDAAIGALQEAADQ